MSDYRRWYVPGGTYFFTVVCYARHPFFHSLTAIQQLGDAMREIRDELPWSTLACVLLPDHLHAVWTLPSGDSDFSTRWQNLKSTFTRTWLDSGGYEVPVTPAQKKKGNRGIWQKRLWEHLVRDEEELDAMVDYIHYNPVKHGYVQRPIDWKWSTFHRFVQVGHYDPQWGAGAEPTHIRNLDYE